MVQEEKFCVSCGRRFFAKRIDTTCCSYECSKKMANKRHKDKMLHGNKRSELLTENGFKCSACGKEGNSFEIVAHHVTLDKADHDNQVLLCRACHASLHCKGREFKPITKELMQQTMDESNSIEEAAGKLGLSKSAMYTKRKMHGLRISRDKKYVSPERFKEALLVAKNTKEAMVILGIASTESFFRKKRQYGLMTGRQGEHHPLLNNNAGNSLLA